MADTANEDTVRRELARGTVELAILSLVEGGARYGYELLTTIEEATAGGLDVREGTLYPVLHRLEDAGYVETSWEAEGRGQPRKYYRITEAGRSRLQVLSEVWTRLANGMDRLLKGGGRDSRTPLDHG